MKSFVKLPLVNRDDWIVKKCSGKRVLHVGCTDAPQTEKKARQGVLLHKTLAQVTDELLGLDIAEKELSFMREELGITTVRYGDAEHLDEINYDRKFDIILVSDVMEHLNNPGLFFDSAKRVLERFGGGELVITVPLAFSIKRMGSIVLRRDEHAHPDHVAYYSPSCIMQFTERYGYNIKEYAAFCWINPTLKNRIVNALAKSAIFLSGNTYLADEIGVRMELCSQTI